MKRLLTFLLFASGIICAADNSVAVTRYRDQDLIPIRTKLRFTTMILLPAGEEIAEVSCGDKEWWVIDGQDNILHVKPAKEGAVTNVNVVLKSKAIYSFLVEEIGSKGQPDLKVMIGQDEVLKLRDEKKALEQTIRDRDAVRKDEIAKLNQERASDEIKHKAALERLEQEMPTRIAAFVAKQKFNYACFTKTETCLGAVFSTDSATYVIGRLGPSPSFWGTTEKGEYKTGIPFERTENVYKLGVQLSSGTVWYAGKSVSFSLK